MTAGIDLVSLFDRYFEAAIFGLIGLGILEGIFYLRYGGNWIKRGVMVWNQTLKDDEWNFLSSQQEDIYEEVKIKHSWYKAKSFVMIRDGKALIRYGNPRQRSSWPMVGYVDLNADEHFMEFRMPLSSLLLVLLLVVFGVVTERYILCAIILVIFAVAFFMEYVSLRDYLKRRTEFFLAHRLAQRPKWNE